MRISELRQIVRNDYLANNTISGREAEDLVGKVVGKSLTSNGITQLHKLRAEFLDSFSAAGLRSFDARVATEVQKRNDAHPASNSPNSVLGVQSGLALDHIEPRMKLSEVKDKKVRDALKHLDVNGDNWINDKDMKILGLSADQLRMFIFSAKLQGAKIDSKALEPEDLAGKKICFTGVADKAKLEAWAKEMGAKVRSTVSKSLDILVVGDASITSKDERALALTELGQANIHVTTDVAFEKAAKAANASGSNPDPMTATQFRAFAKEYVGDWLENHLTEAYAEELAAASTPAARAAVTAKIKSEIEESEIAKNNDSYVLDDRYGSDNPADNNPYRDRLGNDVPKGSAEEWYVSFAPAYAGIGLSNSFVFDTRTGEVLEDLGIQD